MALSLDVEESLEERGMENFQYQALRDVLKVESKRLKEFLKKYREVKVKTYLQKIIKIQYRTAQNTEREHNTIFMGTESLSKR